MRPIVLSSGVFIQFGGYALPDADGDAGQVLTTDGAGNVTWEDVTATAAGSDRQVQFNDSGSLGAGALLTITTDSSIAGQHAILGLDSGETGGLFELESVGSDHVVLRHASAIYFESGSGAYWCTDSEVQYMQVSYDDADPYSASLVLTAPGGSTQTLLLQADEDALRGRLKAPENVLQLWGKDSIEFAIDGDVLGNFGTGAFQLGSADGDCQLSFYDSAGMQTAGVLYPVNSSSDLLLQLPAYWNFHVRGASIKITDDAQYSTSWINHNITGSDPYYASLNFTMGSLSMLTLEEETSKAQFSEGINLAFGTSTGSMIGSAPAELLGFWGATPVSQPAFISDPTGGGTEDSEARTAINAILDLLASTGLMAAS